MCSAPGAGRRGWRGSFCEIAPDGPVSVVVDTPGGSCAEGLAIYTVLRTCGRRVEVVIRRAFSMGAVVAAAGHAVAIEASGHIGLHPAGVGGGCVGTGDADHVVADRLRHLARGLWADEATRMAAQRVLHLAAVAEAADATHLDILARRTGLPRHELTAMRVGEVMLTAERAVALGFADRIVPALG